jgi:hypothetical protein
VWAALSVGEGSDEAGAVDGNADGDPVDSDVSVADHGGAVVAALAVTSTSAARSATEFI